MVKAACNPVLSTCSRQNPAKPYFSPCMQWPHLHLFLPFGAGSRPAGRLREQTGTMAGAQLLRSPTLPACTCLPLAARHPAQLSSQPCTARVSTWPAHSGSSSSPCSFGRRSHTLRVAALEEAPAETSADLRDGSGDPQSLSASGVFADVRLPICSMLRDHCVRHLRAERSRMSHG